MQNFEDIITELNQSKAKKKKIKLSHSTIKTITAAYNSNLDFYLILPKSGKMKNGIICETVSSQLKGNLSIETILEDNVDNKYFLSNEQKKEILQQLINEQKKRLNKRKKIKLFSNDLLKIPLNSTFEVILPVVTPNRITKRQNGRRFKNQGEPSFTLTTIDRHGIIKFIFYKKVNDYKLLSYEVRRFTPLETFRLQGFSDKSYMKAHIVSSESSLYKQSGNAVTTTIPYLIGLKL